MKGTKVWKYQKSVKTMGKCCRCKKTEASYLDQSGRAFCNWCFSRRFG